MLATTIVFLFLTIFAILLGSTGFAGFPKELGGSLLMILASMIIISSITSLIKGRQPKSFS